MMNFKSFINEGGKHPTWVRITVGALVMKMRNLSTQIGNEPNLGKQNQLISQQNKILSYITGLGISVGTDDETLLKKTKSFKK